MSKFTTGPNLRGEAHPMTTERDVLAEAAAAANERAVDDIDRRFAQRQLAALHASGYAIVPEATAQLREAVGEWLSGPATGEWTQWDEHLANAYHAALAVESEAGPATAAASWQSDNVYVPDLHPDPESEAK